MAANALLINACKQSLTGPKFEPFRIHTVADEYTNTRFELIRLIYVSMQTCYVSASERHYGVPLCPPLRAAR